MAVEELANLHLFVNLPVEQQMPIWKYKAWRRLWIVRGMRCEMRTAQNCMLEGFVPASGFILGHLLT